MRKKILLFVSVASFACCSHPKQETRFVTPEQYKANSVRIASDNRKVLQQLSQYGVTGSSDLNLNIYFVTDDSVKAQSLANDLQPINFHANRIHRSPKDPTLWVLSGSADEVKMDSISLNQWINKLVAVAYQHDCEMEGWNPVGE